MANDDAFIANDRIDAPLGAMLPVNGTAAGNGPWQSPSLWTQSTTPDLMALAHGLRRHWVVAVGVGLLCAMIAGPLVWLGYGERFTASSYLTVALQEKPILPNIEDRGADRDRFEIYKNTQQQLLQNRFVLLAALRKGELKDLAVIKESADPVGWLAQQLSVGFPGKAELMEVSVTRRDPREAATLVNGVVEAYINEVVNRELNLKQQHLNELDRAFAAKETDVRDRRTELKKLAETLGTDEKETLTLKQKLALEELTLYRTEMAKVQFDVRMAEGALAAQQADLKGIDTLEITDSDVDMLVQSDPVARQLFIDVGWRATDQAFNQSRVAEGKSSRFVDRNQKDLRTIQDQFDSRRSALTEVARQKRRSMVQAEALKYESTLSVLRDQENRLQAEVDAKQKEAAKFGNSTVDVEMMRADIKNLDLVLAGIAAEKEKLSVEMRNASRVTLLQAADVPEMPSNDMLRMMLTGMSILVALCFPAGVVTLWDTRAKRINNSDDVSRGLQLSVIGSMPLVPAKVIRHLASPSKRYQAWHVRLTESVDGITARLLHKADAEQCRVIMVSSAAGGEGKTTLATQLALSLARTGRRTVLVDFDLRRPAFDEIFKLPLEPGVCEMLRRQNTVSELTHETGTENLSVITAGHWDRFILATLSDGSAADLFKQLREKFDFVVVDTSPILPVADARFVSQHVDAVVLSVLRDVSQAPQIQATCEILAAFGVRSVEAVVTSPDEQHGGGSRGYGSTISA